MATDPVLSSEEVKAVGEAIGRMGSAINTEHTKAVDKVMNNPSISSLGDADKLIQATASEYLAAPFQQPGDLEEAIRSGAGADAKDLLENLAGPVLRGTFDLNGLEGLKSWVLFKNPKLSQPSVEAAVFRYLPHPLDLSKDPNMKLAGRAGTKKCWEDELSKEKLSVRVAFLAILMGLVSARNNDAVKTIEERLQRTMSNLQQSELAAKQDLTTKKALLEKAKRYLAEKKAAKAAGREWTQPTWEEANTP